MGWLPHLHLKSLRLNSTDSVPTERTTNKVKFHRSESSNALVGKEDNVTVSCIGEVLHNILQQAMLGAEQHLVTIFQNREDELLKEIAMLKQQHEALVAENDHLLEIIGLRKDTPRMQEPSVIHSGDITSRTRLPSTSTGPSALTNYPQIFDPHETEFSQSSKKMDLHGENQCSSGRRKIDSQAESTTLLKNDSSDEEFGDEYQCRGVPRSTMDQNWLPRAARDNTEMDSSSNDSTNSSLSKPQLNTTTLNAVIEAAERVVTKTLHTSLSCSQRLDGLDRNDLRV